MKIKAIGDINALPSSLKEVLLKLELETKNYEAMFLNIAIAYGGQQELIEAIKINRSKRQDKKSKHLRHK